MCSRIFLGARKAEGASRESDDRPETSARRSEPGRRAEAKRGPKMLYTCPFRVSPDRSLLTSSPMVFHRCAELRRLVLPTRSCGEICLEKETGPPVRSVNWTAIVD